MLAQMMKTLIIAALLFPATLRAEEIYGNVEFLNGWRLDDGSYQTGIEFDLNEGWKTYWRVPGPAGIPPFFDWGGSSNIASIVVDWPVPHVFETYGLTSIGYKDLMVLPIRIIPIQKNAPVNVELNFEFGVCSDICIPADVRIHTNLGNHPREGVPAIKAALNSRPQSANDSGLRSATCAFTPNGSGFDIVAKLKFTNPLQGDPTTVIEYTDPDIWIDIAETSIEGKNLIANATLEYYGDGMLTIDRSAIRITVLNNDRAVEVFGCPAS